VVDMHSIFLGFRSNGERYYRRNRNWENWQDCGDVIQMNRTEASILAGREFSNLNDLKTFGIFLLSKNTKVVLVTLDVEGVLLLWKSGRKIYSERIPIYNFGETIDPTGCGDIFSSAFSYKYMLGKDPYESCVFANKVAGIRATQKSSDELHRLREMLLQYNIN